MTGLASIDVGVDGRGVATLRLARPDKHNAMDPAMIAELTLAAGRLGADDRVRAVVLTGEGRSFCAGGDLGWMRAQFDASRAGRIEGAMALARMLKALNELPKPLIGCVNGQAYGGGLGLIAVCDVAVGVETATFAFTETRLGIIPATIGPYVLARMGEGRARRVFISGRVFGAQEAVRLGLLAASVAPAALHAAMAEEVEPYLAAAPEAVAAAKALARSLGAVIDEARMRETATLLADAWERPEARARIEAFLKARGGRD